MTSKTMGMVRSHERQLRAIAGDYRAMAKSIDASTPGGPIAIETCNGIVLLLTTAADDLGELKVPEVRS